VHRGLSGPIASGYGAGWHARLDGLGAQLSGDSFDWDARFHDVKAAYSA
jgi:hypothetical protein